ncbi:MULTISPECIES: superoxide dismutase family protein [Clostridia]|uniref:superoxide dismutase family protein n=1 Tax=Clostridia TaxID=186801 RepID=UPI000EA0813D|nr:MULTISPECIES: superoxide dismutase family protein [Clostridia]NBJ70263.1 superoxide dismutase family protein [Roseburia sp. 1XD42-34]RKI76711.1 superoxide dismutase family protein [Clostridium sp. 1xD42-85]
MHKRTIYIMITAICLFILSACNITEDERSRGNAELEKLRSKEVEQTTTHIERNSSKKVFVSLKDRKQQEVATAILTEEEQGVRIKLTGGNFSPGKHGFHIHETGSCEGPDFSSAGEHFNPTNRSHGKKAPGGPHAGDLPNIEVANDGTVQADFLNEMVTLQPEKDHSLVKDGGTALVIHSDKDDYKTQPAGNAGERIACGVISEAK